MVNVLKSVAVAGIATSIMAVSTVAASADAVSDLGNQIAYQQCVLDNTLMRTVPLLDFFMKGRICVQP